MDQSNRKDSCEQTEVKMVSANGDSKTPETGGPTKKPMATIYRECLKNHAASIGGHAVDGCCEFMPDSDDHLKCAACGCHRNFHRRETKGDRLQRPFSFCGCCNALQPPPPPAAVPITAGSEPVKSASPPARVSSPYNSAPQMLLALSGGAPVPEAVPEMPPSAAGGSRKRRMRTKFSKEQKGRMRAFADRIGWKLQAGNEGLVQRFCEEIGIKRSVLKVWIHNNKSNFAKKDQANTTNI